MDKDYLLFHLVEAQEELVKITHEITNNSQYDEAELLIAFQHLYHHINTAWNARNASVSEIQSNEYFNQWQEFPKDISFFR